MAGAGYLLFTAGQVLTAAQVNTYLNQQAVMVFATTAARDAALTTVKSEGMVTFQLDNNDLDIYNGASFSTLLAPAHGVWTTTTMVVTQTGSVTVTNNYSRSMRIARTCIGSYFLTVTGSGTGGSAVIITGIPATAADSLYCVGTAQIFDTSASLRYPGILRLASTAAFDMQQTVNVALDARLGVASFTAGLAVGDTISGSYVYEAAADA